MANYRTEFFRGPLMIVSYAFRLFQTREKRSDNGSVRLSYECTLIRPKTGDFGVGAQYGIDEGSWASVAEKIKECVAGEWGDKGFEKLRNGLIRNPILPGDGKEARNKTTGEIHPGLGPDVQFIRVQANEKFPPTVWAPDAATRILEASGLPSGSWGFPVLNVFAWHNAQNGDGVSIGISSFQLIKKAEGVDVLGGDRVVDPSKFFESVKTEGPAPSGGAASMFD